YRPISLTEDAGTIMRQENSGPISTHDAPETTCVHPRQIERVCPTRSGDPDPKQSTLGTFIDIEGAFDKTTFVAIERALVQRGVSATLSGWIRHMLERRIIKTGDHSSNTGRMALVGRGCPQGGVLSPLLWNLVVDELLSLLNNSGSHPTHRQP